jgi:hypothetical protein
MSEKTSAGIIRINTATRFRYSYMEQENAGPKGYEQETCEQVEPELDLRVLPQGPGKSRGSDGEDKAPDRTGYKESEPEKEERDGTV